MNPKNQLLPLAIVGLSERATNRLRSFLHEVADHLCTVVDLPAAQAIVADVDGDEFDWLQFRAEHPHRPTMVLSRHRPEIEDVIWVPKPIMEAALIEAISWATSYVRQGLTTNKQVQGSRHGADMVVNPARLARASGRRERDVTLTMSEFDDSRTLLRGVQAAVRLAAESKQVVTLDIADEGNLAILPRDSLAAISVDSARLLDWARDEEINAKITFSTLTLEQERELLRRLEQYNDVITLDALLWKLAVWTARGRLPEGADPVARYYLRCWPNFTRLMVIPHAVRIAALGVREPMSLIFIADALEIAPADVFSFYYSAMAIGLAGLAQREDDYLLANRVAEDDPKASLQRAIMHIGRNIG